MDIDNYIITTSVTHYGIAKLVYQAFKSEYRLHIVGKTSKWFSVNTDGSLSIIDDIIIRKRLSTDIADLVIKARDRFKRDPEYKKMEALATNNKSIEALNMTLKTLIEKRISLREVNKIDEGREVDAQIRDTEAALELISMKQELQRADVKDKKIAELIDLEMKLYNSSFKDGIMKALAEMFYVAVEN